MSVLPDELWRRILEIGIQVSNLNNKDLCCVSISCRRLNRLSNEDTLWSTLLSSDFPPLITQLPPSYSSSSSSSSLVNNNHHPPSSSQKSLYKFRFEREKARKLLAHRRAVLRIESQVAEHSRKLQEIQLQLGEECKGFNATLAELSNLRKVRQASVALNVWQPVVIRSRQKQIVEQCTVPVDSRINALEMELKLCKQQLSGFNKAHTDEKRRLDAAKQQLASMKYHPLGDYNLTCSSVDEHGINRKKFKTCID